MIESAPQLAPGDGAKPADEASTAKTPLGSAVQPLGGPASTRVYVDQDGSGVIVYRLVDLATGRVLVELPRERADELKLSFDYAASALLSTSA